MLDEKNKNMILKIVGLAVAVFLLVYIGTIFMGGGGDQDKFANETGPEIARQLKEEGADYVLLTAG